MSYEKFSTYEEAAGNLVNSYQQNAGIKPGQLSEIVNPSVKLEVSKSINSILLDSKLSNCTWHPIKTHGSFVCADGKIANGVCLTNKSEGCPSGVPTGTDDTWVTAGAVQCCTVEYDAKPGG